MTLSVGGEGEAQPLLWLYMELSDLAYEGMSSVKSTEGPLPGAAIATAVVCPDRACTCSPKRFGYLVQLLRWDEGH